ncbi:unnamed protein product, partial [Vitis vinifera]
MMILWVIFELSTTIRGRDEPWPLASFGALTSKMKWRIDQGNGDAGRELELQILPMLRSVFLDLQFCRSRASNFCVIWPLFFNNLNGEKSKKCCYWPGHLIFLLIELTLRLPSLDLSLNETIKGELESQFLDKVIANLGLCVSVYDIRSIDGDFVFPGDGASTYTVEFRLVMFRPFVIPFFNLKDYQCRT